MHTNHSGQDGFSGASTRLDSSATRLDSPSTRLDSPLTRLDGGGAPRSGATVLDDAEAEQGAGEGLVRLPTALRDRYRIVRRLPTAGAEADLFVVETTEGESRERRVVKLYRLGVVPKREVLEKVCQSQPEHVVRVFEFAQSDAHWYEVMEYVRHGSLRDMLRGKPLPMTNLLDLIRELSDGIEHLHGFGLIHRDLKPENVLVRESFPLDLVVADFGISSISELSQHVTSTSRTVRYGAPEALSGVITHAADYWSIGMIVAEACMGRHPLAELSDERLVMQWLTTRPIELSAITDVRLNALCSGLLLRDPKRRWGAEEIRRWLAQDATLLAPRAEAAVNTEAVDQASPRTRTAYSIGGTECWSAQALGVELARHWDIAIKDMKRGLVRKWCERELNSVALDRLFLDHEENAEGLDDHEQLLQIILALCPDIPPNYRGRSLATPADLAALIEAVRAEAAEGDENGVGSQILCAVIGYAGTTQAAPLLERFRIKPGSEMDAICRRMRFTGLDKRAIADDFYAGFDCLVTPAEVGSFRHARLLRLISALSVAIDPSLGLRARAEAQAFAERAPFRFWLHTMLDELAQRERERETETFFEGYLLFLVEALDCAKGWIRETGRMIWPPPIAEEPVASAWRRLVESGAIEAAKTLHPELLSARPETIGSALERLAGVFGVGFDANRWTQGYLSYLATALASIRFHQAAQNTEGSLTHVHETLQRIDAAVSQINDIVPRVGAVAARRDLRPTTRSLINSIISSTDYYSTLSPVNTSPFSRIRTIVNFPPPSKVEKMTQEIAGVVMTTFDRIYFFKSAIVGGLYDAMRAVCAGKTVSSYHRENKFRVFLGRFWYTALYVFMLVGIVLLVYQKLA